MSILPDAAEEVQRIVATAQERGQIMRLLGGLAIRLHSPSASHRSLARDYPDLDFAIPDKRGDKVEKLMPELGYEPNKTFNLLNGDTRLLFYDNSHGRQIDVFVGKFHMSHTVPITQRLALEPLTIPLAELLLTKLQIVQMNEKDIRDLCALLLDHPFGDRDDETFNLPFLAKVCADDWGLWKTVTVSAQKILDHVDTYDIEAGQKLIIVEHLTALRKGLDDVPKSLKWKARDRIGERVQWYELPEEVRRG
ncbi:MAG: nucleotidyltransferase family protein [Chloroflexi bacterium]|nr:nucleotidyltransferase family protein [Chloroflexota bacterium]